MAYVPPPAVLAKTPLLFYTQQEWKMMEPFSAASALPRAEDPHIQSRVERREAREALSAFDRAELDTTSIPSEQLNLVARKRTSLFAWRGQFSPELVQLLLSEYATSDDLVLDPFVGSGTTLFECGRRGLASVGVELNPAAVMMAKTAEFLGIPITTREEHLSRAEFALQRFGLLQGNQFGPAVASQVDSSSPALERFAAALREVQEDITFVILGNVLIGCRSLQGNPQRDVARSFARYASIIRELPLASNGSRVLHCDARAIPLDSGSVGLILTSPPYVNVFNYHQNYRPAVELIGWNLLTVAKSEIGSNRKHRSNRFLTVIQYALDMGAALREARRLLKPTGRMIIVVGRESTVRGVPISNTRLLVAVATATAGFMLTSRQERSFTTRFGELIYEDILHFAPASSGLLGPLDSCAREIAAELLVRALSSTDAGVRNDLTDAISKVYLVKPSPVFRASACTF